MLNLHIDGISGRFIYILIRLRVDEKVICGLNQRLKNLRYVGLFKKPNAMCESHNFHYVFLHCFNLYFCLIVPVTELVTTSLLALHRR